MQAAMFATNRLGGIGSSERPAGALHDAQQCRTPVRSARLLDRVLGLDSGDAPGTRPQIGRRRVAGSPSRGTESPERPQAYGRPLTLTRNGTRRFLGRH
ncbi:hypothetical protein PHLGIDRAFT_164705 [Phlebiopsis gigantea 11061_1 CR5-6]|uniref:Uncharacterized protein n=1 Tax=Phlebiopsis gigantea (strain 11061_1 CR5-6) TaxID=745531 RepID=A0A0C3RVC7_PHLG1|nr:hypothetical protein PHLGIDRAFT_164705 [Phlebiopsis gigantea 11061_1 CR5-6]